MLGRKKTHLRIQTHADASGLKKTHLSNKHIFFQMLGRKQTHLFFQMLGRKKTHLSKNTLSLKCWEVKKHIFHKTHVLSN